MKKQNGITLVVLVITIIVLLILVVVVSIKIAFDGGLITKTSDATIQHTIAAEKEAVQTGYAAYQVELAQKGTAELKIEGAKVEKAREGWNIVFNKTNNEYPINKKGEIIVPWKDNDDGTFTKGDVTVKIGDYVNYDATKDENGNEITGEKATYTSYSEKNASADKNEGRSSGHSSDQVFNLSSYAGGWRVLGIEDGNIILISADIIGPDTGEKYCLRGKNGYTDGPSELNAISAIYGQGKGAIGAKSITVEDINKITRYDPMNTGSGKRYGSGTMAEYGNKVTYFWDGTDKPYYEYGVDSNKNKGSLSDTHNTFNWYDGEKWKKIEKSISATISVKEKITELMSNYYFYYPTTLTASKNGIVQGIKETSNEWKLLFENTGNGKSYWLASAYVYCHSSHASFGVRRVLGESVDLSALVFSNMEIHDFRFGIRPVVTLKSDIQLTGNSADGWNIE